MHSYIKTMPVKKKHHRREKSFSLAIVKRGTSMGGCPNPCSPTFPNVVPESFFEWTYIYIINGIHFSNFRDRIYHGTKWGENHNKGGARIWSIIEVLRI